MRFGLKDVSELPSMDEFEKMASELEETEPTVVADEGASNAAYDADGAGGPELDENAPEEPDSETAQSSESSAQPPASLSESKQEIEPAE